MIKNETKKINVVCFNGKMPRKWLTTPTFIFLLLFKSLLSLKKNDNSFFIFYEKNWNTNKFREIMIKNDFENMLEISEFRFEISL